MNFPRKLLFCAALVLATNFAWAANPVDVVYGVLTARNGMSLYTFDNDPAGGGKSVCNGPCAANWPPLLVADENVSGDFSVILRDDGAKQLAYKGKPLYFWTMDQNPGDRTGDGVKGVWHLATP